MNQNTNDFHILLPSNASMNYFPNNTPDHFQTKLAYPIPLNGEWECCLSEVTIPGKYFTIHPDYNDSYSIETIENVESTSLTPEFVIPLYNEDYQEFTEGVNANVKKLIKDPPITFSFIENKTKIKININPYWELTITDEKANKFLRLLKLNPNKDYVVPGYPAGASITCNYSAPNANFLKNQEIRVALKSPLTKKIYEISLKDLDSSDIFDQITEKIIYETGDVSAILIKQRNKVIVTLNSPILN
ncbi:uncharacterized protein TNCV_4335281 [Trichonephila clavipes]|uniref:Uncharacterized protein n=1 Tax=Trichonephila clavipes TaxID=2585209 RepID=A0A8X6RHF2_TRICX|nr:uncharacterized protein TNCV_4335281 [Trichonephila clavipes]